MVQARPVQIAATPSAVQQLADAYHHRLITAAQIGQYMATKNAAGNAQNAQNILQARAARAATKEGLPEQEAAMAKLENERNKAALQYGDAVKMVPPTHKADGSIDWQHTALRGYKLSLAQAGLQVANQIPATDKAGNKYLKQINSLGEELDPQTKKMYQQMRLDAMIGGLSPLADKTHPDNNEEPPTVAPKSGGPDMAPGAPVSAVPQGAPVIQAAPQAAPTSDMTPNQMRASLAQASPGIPGHVWANMADPDVVKMFHQTAISPAPTMQQMPYNTSTPSAPPQVLPYNPHTDQSQAVPMSQPVIGQYVPGQGMVTEESSSFGTPTSIIDELHKQKSYEAFDQQKGYANGFLNTARQIAAIPQKDQVGKPMNQLDQSLAESLIKMYDPQGTIREFKWDKFADNQPLLERLKNAQMELTQTGTFTPQTRSRLMGLGIDTIHSKEGAAAPQIQLAAKRLQAAGIDPTTQLDADEQRIAAGQGHSISGPGYVPDSSTPNATTGQPAAAKTVRLSNGTLAQLGPDNQWYAVDESAQTNAPAPAPVQQAPVVQPDTSGQ